MPGLPHPLDPAEAAALDPAGSALDPLANAPPDPPAAREEARL